MNLDKILKLNRSILKKEGLKLDIDFNDCKVTIKFKSGCIGDVLSQTTFDVDMQYDEEIVCEKICGLTKVFLTWFTKKSKGVLKRKYKIVGPVNSINMGGSVGNQSNIMNVNL